MIALALAIFLTQTPEKDPPPPPPMNEEQQKCVFECAQKASECMQTCAPSNPADDDDPKKGNEFLACTKKCAVTQQPCVKACESKAKKDKKKGPAK